MIKYLISFLIIFFLHGLKPVYSQTGEDSVFETEGNDSVETEMGDSAETLDINPYSKYRLLSHSGMSATDSVRKVSQHQVRSYLLNPDYAYANDPAYWQKKLPEKPGILSRIFSSPALWRILLGGIILLLLYGIYQLAKENNFSWLARNSKDNIPGTPDILTEGEVDYETAIRKYQAEGNYQMAVRYLYLRLIHTLQGKKDIQFRDSSTNADILNAFGNNPNAGDFRFLATAYEYIYYGGFVPRQDVFEMIKNKFDAFQQSNSI